MDYLECDTTISLLIYRCVCVQLNIYLSERKNKQLRLPVNVCSFDVCWVCRVWQRLHELTVFVLHFHAVLAKRGKAFS